MEKIILVDGNNLLFRSYYATAYNGNFMKNSKGFPTNALFGFTNMINKIILEEKPVYMIVAFDKGKTFRHEKYDFYKGGRNETPDELKMQFPIAKELLTNMGIKYYEIDNYEADDIIGTFAKYCDDDSKYVGTIISSDKDLLQLISKDVDIKLLKQKDYIRYNEESFKEVYGINPINIIDLKALQGDPSDNIPGVRGIGEKTALKLLQEYKTLDGIYDNIDKISGKTKEKLLNDKDSAYMSYEIATICKEVPIDITIDDLKYLGPNHQKLNEMYEDLEFYSFLKHERQDENKIKKIEYKVIDNVDEIDIKDCAGYLEILGTNYHNAKILGLALYNDEISYYIPANKLKNGKYLEKIKYTYDYKKMYVALKWQGININNVIFDTMIAGYLLDYNVKDDIAYLANNFDYDIPFYESVFGKKNLKEPSEDVIIYNAISKAKFIYDSYELFDKKLKEEELDKLYYEIELPVATVLGDMEYNGVYLNKEALLEMKQEMEVKIELLTKDIYNYAGTKFNISSPTQLSEILFEKLNLSHGKKIKNGYSTSIEVLTKIKNSHPIVDLILEYRMISKLYTTYVEGLLNYEMKDGKIHTIYTQTLTRTGRLSSIEPNLQNIPVRYEYGKLIRKAFIPSPNSKILSADYSQIELRILAHIAKVEPLIDAFNKGADIHTKTASDIFDVSEDMVLPNMRRIAKAVNFGIVYGISPYGLAENLDIRVEEAKKFIDNYFESYPGIKKYMDETIKKAYENGYVRTLYNRKRNIDELNSKIYNVKQQGERIALNTPIQGTNADILKKAMVEIDREFKNKKLKTKMIIQVHDELVFDVLNNELDEVIKIVTQIMENTCTLSVPLKVEIVYGDNWYQAK